MAKIIDEIKVQVSVETILQRALIEVAQGIFEKHGARLNHVNFEWCDISTESEIKPKVSSCQISTTYTPE